LAGSARTASRPAANARRFDSTSVALRIARPAGDRIRIDVVHEHAGRTDLTARNARVAIQPGRDDRRRPADCADERHLFKVVKRDLNEYLNFVTSFLLAQQTVEKVRTEFVLDLAKEAGPDAIGVAAPGHP
jgi:hypothetical protein